MSDQGPIDHSGCQATSFGNINGHTHEGEAGYWAFPGEVLKSPSPEALQAATENHIALLGYQLGQALGHLETGCTHSTKLAKLAGGMGAEIQPSFIAPLKAALLRITDYAHTIEDQIEGKI